MSELDEPTERMSKITANAPEQLRECINSGQVSAAQIVAHAENGEVGHPGTPFKDHIAKVRSDPVRAARIDAMKEKFISAKAKQKSMTLKQCIVDDKSIGGEYWKAYAEGLADDFDELVAALAAEREQVTAFRAILKDAIHANCALQEEKTNLTDALAAERAEVARLREALSFYADPERYHGPNQRVVRDHDKFTPDDAVYVQDVTRDSGDIARAALGENHE